MPYPRALGFAALLATACTPAVGASSAEVVYGSDDRVEVYEATSNTHRAIAESAIAMQVSTSQIDDSNPADVRIAAVGTVGEAEMLCAGERFADQPNPGECSATLIDARHVLTAGHCVARCSAGTSWVFGYRYVAPGTLATLTTDDVYSCASVPARRISTGGDYAVVTLDRDVVGHVPVEVGRTRPLPTGTSLTLIGHPDGMPMKIAGGANVVDPGSATFTATVDAFAGNSGSGVFDDAGRVVGILDSGNQDYAWNGSCFVVNVIDPTSGQGESLTYVDVAMAAYCATAEGAASPLCGGTGVDAAASDDASAPVDGGTTPAPSASSGCGCAVGARDGGASALLAGLVVVALALRRASKL